MDNPRAGTFCLLLAIGLGTWKYRGGSKPLQRGIELGATFIDTAEMYRTEDQVGEAIRGIRDKLFIATKVSGQHLRRDDVDRQRVGAVRIVPTRLVPEPRDDHTGDALIQQPGEQRSLLVGAEAGVAGHREVAAAKCRRLHLLRSHTFVLLCLRSERSTPQTLPHLGAGSFLPR